MNKNAKKWVHALRSKQYAQTTGTLCKEGKSYDKFCCLGVACDLYQQEKGDLIIENHHYCVDELSYDGCTGSLPIKVQTWLGLTTRMGDYDCKDLTVENDNGKSFKQIAQIIEDNEKELFV